MVNEKNVACKKMYGDIKRENIIWKNKQNKTKQKRLIVHANMKLWERCVNETILHAKFLYLIYKTYTH